jgi:16S rRNA (adenine1518-N6/adenine1519-N6)-dimethyltransferase
MLSTVRLRDILKRYDLRPLKRFGENYLIDSNIKDKIIAQVSPSKKDIILEIGPGLGAITIDLAASGAVVLAVEKDRKVLIALRDMTSGYSNLKLIEGDILKFDIARFGAANKIKVAGNLPYYITTKIIEYLIDHRNLIDLAVIMMQKEVADRMLAKPGAEDYSALSCFVQYYAKPSCIHTVKRTSFYPVPDVDSSLIRLDMLEKPSVEVRDEDLFFKIIRGAFNQRRKSIINSLSRKVVLDMSKRDLMAALQKLKIDPFVRPETLGLPEFAKIANLLSGV